MKDALELRFLVILSFYNCFSPLFSEHLGESPLENDYAASSSKCSTAIFEFDLLRGSYAKSEGDLC